MRLCLVRLGLGWRFRAVGRSLSREAQYGVLKARIAGALLWALRPAHVLWRVGMPPSLGYRLPRRVRGL